VARARELEGLVPPILAAGNNFYKYRKIEGDLFANSVTLSKFKNFLEWSAGNLWSPRECKNFPDLCHSFYIDKTLSRISKYLEKNSDSAPLINQEEVPPIEDLINQIDTEWLCDGIPVQFHGDFILDNILETDEGFCLLDWRQDFAGHLTIGDIYYDLAKLNHNLTVNHELVNKRAFNSSSDNCYILCNSKLVDCKEILKNFIVENGYDYKKVQALTAVIWINMAPLHEYPFDKFLFNFGKLNLKRALDGKN
jgi:thiamine kinase-like enzyme